MVVVNQSLRVLYLINNVKNIKDGKKWSEATFWGQSPPLFPPGATIE